MHASRAPAALLLLLAACRPAPAPAQGGRGLEILPYDGPLAPGVQARDPRAYFHDFGVVHDGDTVVRVFRLRNTDPGEVAIKRVDPGCGCTVAALRVVHADGTLEAGLPVRSRAEKLLVVPSGEEAELEIKVDTRDLVTKNTHKLITIRVLTDSPNGYFLTFEVHLYVQQPFAIVPGTLAFGDVAENGGGSARVEIVPAGTTVHELTELGPLPAGMSADLLKEIRQGRGVWVLSARLEPPLERGPRHGALSIATLEPGGLRGRDLEVPFTANVVGDLLADPQRIAFRASERRSSGSCELVSLLAGQRLRLTGIDVPADQRDFLTASYEPVQAEDEGRSERWRITLELRASPPDREILSGTLGVHLDDPQHPSYALDYVIHLR
jgi:hypothetical protein